MLAAVGHEALLHHKAGIALQLGNGGALGGVDAFDLLHLHLHGAAFLHIYLGHRVQDASAAAVAGAVMLLHIADFGALFEKEAVNAVVLGILAAAVVDAAAGDDDDVAVGADIEVVIDRRTTGMCTLSFRVPGLMRMSMPLPSGLETMSMLAVVFRPAS